MRDRITTWMELQIRLDALFFCNIGRIHRLQPGSFYKKLDYKLSANRPALTDSGEFLI